MLSCLFLSEIAYHDVLFVILSSCVLNYIIDIREIRHDSRSAKEDRQERISDHLGVFADSQFFR